LRSSTLVIALGIVLLCGVGCHTAHVTQPLPEKLYSNDADAQMDFWHTLEERKLTSNDEAFHGLLLYFDGSDKTRSYAERVALLKSRRMLSPKFDRPADEAVTRGTLSVAIARGLQIKGGVMMRLTGGTNERYATRELQSEGVYPVSSPNQLFSGAEFVGVVGKLDDYQHGIAQPVTNRLNEQ
jgi:hypothetical protein